MRIEMHRFRSQRSGEIRCLGVASTDIELVAGTLRGAEGFGGLARRDPALHPFSWRVRQSHPLVR